MKYLYKETATVWLFSFFKIPLLLSVRPKVKSLTLDQCQIEIPLTWFTKNHLGSMYFGVLAIGADCSGGFLAKKVIDHHKARLSLIFKDFHAEFLKRPEGDTVFTCNDGKLISQTVERAANTKERENCPLHITATVPAISNEPVAKFTLTLSLKVKA